jgi:lysophospholipase L1-like esterase
MEGTMMRLRPAAALLLGMGLAVTALGADTAPATAPKTTVPDDRNYVTRPEFQTSWEDYLATKKGKPIDLIFIGDSITQQWRWGLGKSVWEKHYADRGLDFGEGSDTTQNAIWRLKNLDIREFKPKVAVVMIGTNNTRDTPEDIAAGVKAVATTTQEIFPGVKVVLLSILPNQRANEKMMAANEIVKTFANNDTIFYLDLASKFPKEGDNWKGLQKDHLHLTTDGYEVWAATLDQVIEKLIPAKP